MNILSILTFLAISWTYCTTWMGLQNSGQPTSKRKLNSLFPTVVTSSSPQMTAFLFFYLCFMLLFVFVHMSDCWKKWKWTQMNAAECILRSDLDPKLNFAKSEQKNEKIWKPIVVYWILTILFYWVNFFQDYSSFFLFFSPCYAMGKFIFLFIN